MILTLHVLRKPAGAASKIGQLKRADGFALAEQAEKFNHISDSFSLGQRQNPIHWMSLLEKPFPQFMKDKALF